MLKTYEQVVQVKQSPPQKGLNCQSLGEQSDVALCTEFLSFSSKVTIGIIFLQNDSCYDNHSKFSFSETDVSFSWKLECEKPMGKINSNFNRTLTTM